MKPENSHSKWMGFRVKVTISGRSRLAFVVSVIDLYSMCVVGIGRKIVQACHRQAFHGDLAPWQA